MTGRMPLLIIGSMALVCAVVVAAADLGGAARRVAGSALLDGVVVGLLVMAIGLAWWLAGRVRATRRALAETVTSPAYEDLPTPATRVMRRALDEDDGIFRTLADSAPVLVWIAGKDGGRTFLNKPWLAFTGRRLEQELGDGWLESVHPDDLERCCDTYRASFEARTPFRLEHRLRRADGTYRWVLDNGIPLLSPAGSFVGYIGSCIDVTELRMVREELEQRVNERTRAIERANVRLRAQIGNRRQAQNLLTRVRGALEGIATGEPLERVLDRLCLDIGGFLPECRCAVLMLEDEGLRCMAAPALPGSARASLQDAASGLPAQLRTVPSGGLVPVEEPGDAVGGWCFLPVRSGGELLGALGIGHPVGCVPDRRQGRMLVATANTAGIAIQRSIADRKRLLAESELDHRVKNTLASVETVARLSLDRAGSLDEFRVAFLERIQSMSLTHEMLAATHWRGADLGTLVTRILGPYTDALPGRISVEGPALIVAPESATPLSMALHELATNAAKHGALSVPDGRVAVTWGRTGGNASGLLELAWREHNGPAVRSPGDSGVGTSIIEGMVGFQLRGTVDFDWAGDGAVCRIRVPFGTAVS